MPYETIEELQKLGVIDRELDEFLKAHPLPEFDTSNLPLFKSIVQEQEKGLPGLLGPSPTDVRQSETHYTTRDGAQIRMKLYQPATTPSSGSPLVVIFHGGGWCTGTAEMEEITSRNLVQAFGVVCISCEYRLAPEFKFPTGVLDAWDSLRWAASNAKTLGANPALGFVLGGTSAGGNLAAVLSHMARDQGLQPPLTGLYLHVPAVGGKDVSVYSGKYRARAISFAQNEFAPLISKAVFEMLENGYAPDTNDHELYSVIAHPKGHKDLPPTYFQLCGMDPLRDEGLIYLAVLKDAGVKTELTMYPGLPHDFSGLLPHLKSTLVFRKDQMRGFGWLLGQDAMMDKVTMFA